jgi:dextranase
MNRSRVALLVCVALACAGATLGARVARGDALNDATTVVITHVSSDRGAYAPGADVALTIALHNGGSASFAGTVTLSFSHLGTSAAPDTAQAVTLAPGADSSYVFDWSPPATDFTGYLVGVAVRDAGNALVASDATAVDVSSDWTKFPRYGFVSNYGAGVDAAGEMQQLADRHINAVQFYDWQWKHHVPYSPAASWPDIANRPTDRGTVNALIADAHDHGMLAMNYNLAAGAYNDYQTDGSGVQLAWGLFTDNLGNYTESRQFGHPLPSSWATTKLDLFNPANPAWQSYICNRERDVFANFAFDGWHIDSLGNLGRAYDANGKLVLLDQTFTGFVNYEKACLGTRVVFNSVGTYGQDAIAANGHVDVVYSELWDDPGTRYYGDLQKVVARVRAKTTKALVVAGYVNHDAAQKVPDGSTRPFDEASVRLADAALFALGATHIELGDGGAMLSSEYFPNQKLVMSDTLRAAVDDLYNFQVGYENLLRDGATPAKNRVEIHNGAAVSPSAALGRVWAIPTQQPGRVIVNLVNLVGAKQKFWRDVNAVQPIPKTLTNLTLKLYHSLPGTPHLRVASPDTSHGAAVELPYTAGHDARGNYVQFTLPSLQYWDLVWLDAN